MSEQSKTGSQLSVYDAIGLIVSTAREAEAQAQPVLIRQDAGLIAVFIMGYKVDDQGQLVATDSKGPADVLAALEQGEL